MAQFWKFAAMITLGLIVSFATIVDADARRGGSFGSRGSRTFDAPPATRTAPQPAQPIQRSTAPQPGQPGGPAAAAAQQGARPSMFGTGFAGNMMRGLLIGGLLGALLGYGFGGMAGMLGFLLQAGLIMLGVVLLMRFLANRRQQQQPATVRAANRADPMNRSQQPANGGFNGLPGMGGGSGMGGAMGGARPGMPAAPAIVPIEVTPADLEIFQGLLSDIQVALGRRDVGTIRTRSTPEVAAFLEEDFAEAERQGITTDISDVVLLQGDVAEAWREGRDEYATVAMRFSLREVTREAATGRVVAGNPDEPTELTEVWTFVRTDGGDWKLSAIQEV